MNISYLNPTRSRARSLTAFVAGAAAVSALALGGPAAAQAVPTITMAGGEENLRFNGPNAVRSGKPLQIVNRTDPEEVGPHTFTLLNRKLVPTTRKQQRQCFDGGICFDVAIAHKLDFETDEVRKPIVDVGRRGWDRPFTRKRAGDSWYTETRGESSRRRVSAKPGRTLHYFCAVHPFMQGKVKVR